MISLLLSAALVIPAVEPPQCNLPGWGVVKQSLTTRTVITTRAPVGHTHTCARGHTWDHSENPTHNCRFCGLFQNVQDRTPRAVTIIRTERIPQPLPVGPELRPTQAVQYPTGTQIIQQMMRSNSNCPNGQCPYVR
jgi:hypothetical protein